MDIEKNWTDFKTAWIKKSSPPLQYIEKEWDYTIWFSDNDRVFTIIDKDTPATTDQTDFETNYKDDCNKPTHTMSNDNTPYVRVTEKTVGKMMQLYGIELTASADDTTNYDVKWSEDIEFVGLKGCCENAHYGDKVNAVMIDKDNILGYGANFVVAEFGKNVPAMLLDIMGCSAETTTAVTLMAGLYLRLSYVNAHATEDAKLYIALRYYH